MLDTTGALQIEGMPCMGMELSGQPGWALLGMPGMPGDSCMAMKSPPFITMGGWGITPTGGIMPGGICEIFICAGNMQTSAAIPGA